jgi:5-methylcytosine-specific restriction endonuclease McrA|tara:strand:- start:17 stop:889 length:873 start_codon:yes stop_codon:yes gene_type:complete
MDSKDLTFDEKVGEVEHRLHKVVKKLTKAEKEEKEVQHQVPNVEHQVPNVEEGETIYEEVKEITGNYKTILSIEKAQKLELHGGPGNGSGSRNPISDMFINTTIYGSKRLPMTYPKCYDDIIILTEGQLKMVEEYKKERKEKGQACGSGVIGFIIHGKNNEEKSSRPIHNDIKKFHSKFACITCGTSNTICDHKNDLYNDPRVLDMKTQTRSDFQPLCNNCNLRKRAVSLKTVKEKKRQPPPKSVLAMNGGITFISGDESFDPKNPHAMVGTYWYDPIEFGKECLKILQN